MKKILIILNVLICTLFVHEVRSNEIDTSCSHHVIWGAPQINKEGYNQYICRIGYAANYNYDTKVSYFTVEHLISTHLIKTVSRNDDFREDLRIPGKFRATLKDYIGNGYDRGHMAPAANFTYAANVMSESFFLTNMMPQVPGNNRGIWKALEEKTRSWVQTRKTLYIITGTVYDKSPAKIMGNGVKVPSHVYKIIIDADKKQSISFMFPNEKLDTTTMEQYVVSISDIEKVTKINFNPNISKKDLGIEKQKGILKNWE